MTKFKVLLLTLLIFGCTKEHDKQNILNTIIEHISSHHVPFMKMHYHNDSIVLNNNGKVILLHPKMNLSLFTNISKLEQIQSNDGYFAENQLTLNPKKITQNGVKIRSYHFPDDKRANDILHEEKAHAILIFAPFIYNDNMTEAVLFVNYVCGGLCGGVYKYTLIKKGVNWEISDTESITIY